jgi:hypothetical protein
MSLSGQYLEELSRRYKRQVDDMQKSLNRTLQVRFRQFLFTKYNTVHINVI